jgi:hypothetical protein
VPICWLSLLLARIAEAGTGMSGAVIRRIMQRLPLGESLPASNRNPPNCCSIPYGVYR